MKLELWKNDLECVLIDPSSNISRDIIRELDSSLIGAPMELIGEFEGKSIEECENKAYEALKGYPDSWLLDLTKRYNSNGV